MSSTIGLSTSDYGSDFGTFIIGPDGGQDLDPTFAPITGPRVVLETLARRLLTPNGMLEDDPGFGFDLRVLLGSTVDEGLLRKQISGQIRGDERIQGYALTVSLNTSTSVLSVRIDVRLREGTFPLTIKYDRLTTQINTVFGYG
jgi:hypothetical protein